LTQHFSSLGSLPQALLLRARAGHTVARGVALPKGGGAGSWGLMGLLLPRRHQGLLLPGHQHLPGPEPGVLCFSGHEPGGADCLTDPSLGPGHLEGRLAGLHGGLLSFYPVSSLGPELGLEAGSVVGPGVEQVVGCLPLFGPGLLAGCALPWGRLPAALSPSGST